MIKISTATTTTTNEMFSEQTEEMMIHLQKTKKISRTSVCVY